MQLKKYMKQKERAMSQFTQWANGFRNSAIGKLVSKTNNNNSKPASSTFKLLAKIKITNDYH